MKINYKISVLVVLVLILIGWVSYTQYRDYVSQTENIKEEDSRKQVVIKPRIIDADTMTRLLKVSDFADYLASDTALSLSVYDKKGLTKEAGVSNGVEVFYSSMIETEDKKNKLVFSLIQFTEKNKAKSYFDSISIENNLSNKEHFLIGDDYAYGENILPNISMVTAFVHRVYYVQLHMEGNEPFVDLDALHKLAKKIYGRL